jgi:predicted flap endonuclease-1-like 5' DNA nuclease
MRVLGILIGLVLAGAGLVLFGWLLWWLWSQQDREKAAVVEIELDTVPPPVGGPDVEIVAAAEAPEAPEEVDEPQATAADDLKRIEGIGPRIAGVLQEAGITTFSRLAEMEAAQIEEVLAEADPRLARLARPATWPEQAALAAEGQWDVLEALQGDLKGGRRA